MSQLKKLMDINLLDKKHMLVGAKDKQDYNIGRHPLFSYNLDKYV